MQVNQELQAREDVTKADWRTDAATTASSPIEREALAGDAVAALEGQILIVNPSGGECTKVLVRRVQRLLERGEPAGSILLLAGNRRPTDLIGQLVAMGLSEAERIETRSVSALFLKLLREHHFLAGLGEDFSLLPDHEVLQHLAQLAEGISFVRRGRGHSHSSDLKEIIDRITLRPALSIESIIRTHYPGYRGFEAGVHAIHERYKQSKSRARCVDRFEVIARARSLVGEQSIREQFCRRYRHVLVDVGESIACPAFDVLAQLIGVECNLLMVADDDQQLERFILERGDTVAEFHKRFPRGQILGAAHRLRRPDPLARLLNDLSGKTVAEPSSPVVNVTPLARKNRRTRSTACATLHVSPNDGLLAALITEQIQRLVDDGIAVSNQVVLSAERSQMYALQSVLRSAGISFHVLGHQSNDRFAHVEDVLAHLHVLSNPRQTWAWRRCFQFAGRLGVKATERLVTVGSRSSNLEAMLAAVADTAAEQFPKFRKHVAALTSMLTVASRRDTTGAKYDVVLAYAEPVIERQYKDRLDERLDELDALRSVATRCAMVSEFVDSFTTEPPGLLNQRSTAARSAEADVPLVLAPIELARGRGWDAVHVLLPSDIYLADPSASDDPVDIALARRQLYTAAIRARRHLALYLTRPRDGRPVVIAESLIATLQLHDRCHPKAVKLPDKAAKQGSTGAASTGPTGRSVDPIPFAAGDAVAMAETNDADGSDQETKMGEEECLMGYPY